MKRICATCWNYSPTRAEEGSCLSVPGEFPPTKPERHCGQWMCNRCMGGAAQAHGGCPIRNAEAPEEGELRV